MCAVARPHGRLNEFHNIRHVFLMTGAEANTGWLNGRVTLDEKGFMRTRTGPERGRSNGCAVATRALAVSARNLASGRVRRGRRSVRQHQARGIGRQ